MWPSSAWWQVWAVVVLFQVQIATYHHIKFIASNLVKNNTQYYKWLKQNKKKCLLMCLCVRVCVCAFWLHIWLLAVRTNLLVLICNILYNHQVRKLLNVPTLKLPFFYCSFVWKGIFCEFLSMVFGTV